MKQCGLKRSGTTFVAPVDCNCGGVHLKSHGDKIIIVCPHKPARYLNEDGTYAAILDDNQSS